MQRWCRGAGAELVLVLRFRCRCAAIAVVLVLLVQILYWCRGCAARWCKEGGAGAEMQVQRFHIPQRCRGADRDAEMQRCRDTVVCRGGAGAEVQVQRWCSKVVKTMCSGAE